MTIPFETGIPSLLKEKGFDEKTEKYWIETIDPDKFILSSKKLNEEELSAPDYDQVLDWLEEKHDIIILPYYGMNSKKWRFILIKSSTLRMSTMFKYPTRYEALNAGIIGAIKLIK